MEIKLKELIAQIKKDGRIFSVEISEWTLYSYITKGVFRTLTNKDLPMRGEKKQEYKKVKAARLPAGDSIEDRDPEILERATFGNWEMDTVESAKKKTERLLVLTERGHGKRCARQAAEAAGAAPWMPGPDADGTRRQLPRPVRGDEAHEDW